MVRFGLWDDILREPEPSADQIFGRMMRHFARGFALSGLDKPEEARAELATLRTLAADPSLSELKIFDLNRLSDLAAIAVSMLEGELELKAGRHDNAVASLRKAVQRDDDLLYSEPPDWMLPPRQYLANALEAAGKYQEAEKVYREDLKRHRANGWSLFGLEQCLRKQGRTRDAEEVKRQLQQAWTRADVQLRASRF